MRVRRIPGAWRAERVAVGSSREEKMRLLITGASGLIGSSLVPFLRAAGHTVVTLVRQAPGAGQRRWDPAAGILEAATLDGMEGVVHLAGENIAAGRWTVRRKARIRNSRVEGTRLLSGTLAGLAEPPRVMLAASAVGYYGSRGDDELDETSGPGDDFLAEVCQAWETATEPARTRGIRVVNLRIGVVLSASGGALARMLTPFRLGLGGPLGDGRQFMSWIAIDDLVGIIGHALADPSLAGPLNAVAPGTVTNREFTRTLGRVLRRPTLLPMPGTVARLAFGEMADALLLSSARVRPARLLESGYAFRFPDLEGALRHVLGRA